jgi:hypothetical protein
MTGKQEQILRYLRICTSPASPTEIGMACGKSYSVASSWASSGLKSLVASGQVKRFDGGHYELVRAA